MRLSITHCSPEGGGETRVSARDDLDQGRNIDDATPNQPLAAVQELAGWCERWGLPRAAERLRSDLVAHIEALDAHEEKLIEGLVRTRGRRQAMVDSEVTP